MQTGLLLLQRQDAGADPGRAQGIQRLTQRPLVQVDLPLQFVVGLAHLVTTARGRERLALGTALGSRVQR